LLAESPLNGYQIIQEITERSQGLWRPSPGSVYPALQQLEDEGLVRAEEAGGRRKHHLTTTGRQHVQDHHDRIAAPWVAVAESVTEEMVDVRMLFSQVNMALEQVMRAGSARQLTEAGTVLTNARRALYRILADDLPGDARRAAGAAEATTTTRTTAADVTRADTERKGDTE
jgi:DNA-binding PadR family transcriptional regulator